MDSSTVEQLRIWREHPAQFVRDVFNAEPDLWQEEALEAFPGSPRICMRACAGPGKAQPLDTMVDTPDGLRRWGSLKSGDRLFAEDGSPTVIKSTFMRGSLPVYRITFDDGCSTLACGEHLWKVRGRTERCHFKARNNPKWTARTEFKARAQGHYITPSDGYSVLSTEEIIERNQSGDGKRRQFEIPRQGEVFFPRADLPLDPYILGVWLGDGNIGSGRGSWRDQEIDTEIIRRGYEVGRSADRKSVTVYGISKHLRGLGLIHLNSPYRFLPIEYRYASAEQRAAIISGLMDTDGSIADDGSMSFDVTSSQLVDDVAWLVRSLGGVATKRKPKKGVYRNQKTGELIECRLCYRLTITLPFNPFNVRHKFQRWKSPQTRYLTRYIDSITPIDNAECMCVEVDHHSSCYLTNDFIVTHNTTVLAWLGWNYMVTRPHPMVGATSISGANLKASLWTEFARWRSKSRLLTQTFEQTKTEIFHREHPQTWRIEARTWAQDADQSQIGNALAGLHAKYVMWLLDESGDYPESIMPVCESIFNGNPVEAHIVQAGNPTRLSGPLYRACTVAKHLWRVIEITADPDDPKRTPRVSKEVAREQIEQYGRDNPWVMVRIFGKFPPAALNALIGPDEISAAMKRCYREYEYIQSPKVLGVDVAAYGDDSSVICPRQGLVVFPMLKFRNIDSTQGAGAVVRKWNDWDADACFVDATGGFGAGWIDAMRLLGRAPIGVQYAGSPHNKSRYANKRAEMYFEAVQWIKEGGQLPPSSEITAALTNTTYTFKGDRLLLEPKEAIKLKIGYSPDEADAFVQTFAEPVAARNIMATGRRSRHQYEYDPFA